MSFEDLWCSCWHRACRPTCGIRPEISAVCVTPLLIFLSSVFLTAAAGGGFTRPAGGSGGPWNDGSGSPGFPGGVPVWWSVVVTGSVKRRHVGQTAGLSYERHCWKSQTILSRKVKYQLVPWLPVCQTIDQTDSSMNTEITLLVQGAHKFLQSVLNSAASWQLVQAVMMLQQSHRRCFLRDVTTCRPCGWIVSLQLHSPGPTHVFVAVSLSSEGCSHDLQTVVENQDLLLCAQPGGLSSSEVFFLNPFCFRLMN